MDEDQLRLADPQLGLELLETLRQDGDALIDDLDDPMSARAWLERVGLGWLGEAAIAELSWLRDRLRVFLTALVGGDMPDDSILDALNQAAADAPVTLRGLLADDGTLHVERTTPTTTDGLTTARAHVARGSLALLTEPVRSQLRLCDAPNCVRFFLKQHPRQEWCTPACGNRARVARHYARHRRS
jgi:predicted RNA-binding Zn ribbon-like protein